MSTFVQKYLCAQPSVESERLFSVGGAIFSPQQNKMTADTGEKLMFIH